MVLVDKTDALAIPETSPFYVDLCAECQCRLQGEIEGIDDRASGLRYGHERLAALAEYLDSRRRVRDFRDGCTICGKFQRRALMNDNQGILELLRASSCS